MRIEVDGKGSKAFYREVVNIVARYRSLLKNPHLRLRDHFRQFLILLILGAAVLGLLVVLVIRRGAGARDWAAMMAGGLSVVISAGYLVGLNRMLKTMMSDERSSVVTLDETGVELNKGGSQIVKLGWDNIALVRVFRESIAFVSADRAGLVIALEKKYAGKILEWIKENGVVSEGVVIDD